MPGLDCNLVRGNILDDDITVQHPFDSDDNSLDEDSDLDSNTFDIESEHSDSMMDAPAVGAFDALFARLVHRSTRIMVEQSRTNKSTQTTEYPENDAESILETAFLTNLINNDQYDSIGNSVTRELKNMAAEQREIAQDLITKVLNEGLSGRLTSSTIVCPLPKFENEVPAT